MATLLQQARDMLKKVAVQDCKNCEGTGWHDFKGTKIICGCIDPDIGSAYWNFVDGYLTKQEKKRKM